ncbi:hypothetical protein [Streptomyces sp. NPDC003077]|uniref:hypothetical protein n=1 Tax=Streptomyces sp. NPDC003077 TaxID=3154443 RepID=UPI00339E3FA4
MARGGALVAGAVLMLAVAGCDGAGDGHGDDGRGGERRAAPPPSPMTDPPARLRVIGGNGEDEVSVTDAVKPSGDGKVLLRTGSRQGNAEMPLRERIPDGPVSVAFACQGRGTITVSLTSVGASFPIDCVADKVTSVQNVHSADRGRPRDAAVRVEAPSAVRWAVTVERGAVGAER